MRFPRCYFCRRVLWWPFGLSIFRGWTGLHVAHQSCLAHAHRRPKQSLVTLAIGRPLSLLDRFRNQRR
jgi:hypothetical protein